MDKEEIKKYIDNFKDSSLKQKMLEGVDYYNQKNTKIAAVKKQYYSVENESVCNDPYKANHKLYSGYLKLLIKQKVGYSINKSISINGYDVDTIKELLPSYVHTLKELATEGSIKSRAVLQFYIDENGKLKYKQIPAEQVIIIENEENRKLIDKVIRFYKKGENIIVEVYDDKILNTYKFKGNWELEEHSQLPLLVDKTIYSGSVQEVKENTWGKPPFAILYNNFEKQTDLEPIKSYIDIYDITASDFANNIDDFQDVYLTLKNFYGDNEDLGQVLRDLKRHKVVVTDGEDTGADFNTVEIPVNARESMLKLAEDNIYKFGMGLNMDNMDGNITNVRIKAMYSNLNLKANDFESELQVFWKQVMYFVNKYLELNGREPITSELVFVRDKIVNEAEVLDSNAKQKGVVSEDTRLSNHIWVTDVEEEKKKLEEEEKPISLTNTNIQDML